MKARSAFAIQKDVIFAIFLREMNSRFSGYTFGNVWIILEPLIMMMTFILIFGVRGRGSFGGVEPPVFILSAFLPFRVLWGGTMRKNMSALGLARGLMGYRQIRLFDIFLTRSIVEGGIYIVAGVILCSLFLWAGFSPIPRDILLVLWHSFELWLFSAFVGILLCVVCSIAKEVERAVGIITMPLMFVSAVFYPMTVVPITQYHWFVLNPLVHANELIREAWLPNYVSPVADETYLWGCIICVASLAMASYRLHWQRMVAT